MRNNTAIFSNANFTTALTAYTTFMSNQRVNITSCMQVLHAGIHYIIISFYYTV